MIQNNWNPSYSNINGGNHLGQSSKYLRISSFVGHHLHVLIVVILMIYMVYIIKVFKFKIKIPLFSKKAGDDECSLKLARSSKEEGEGETFSSFPLFSYLDWTVFWSDIPSSLVNFNWIGQRWHCCHFLFSFDRTHPSLHFDPWLGPRSTSISSRIVQQSNSDQVLSYFLIFHCCLFMDCGHSGQ